VDIYKAKNSA
jgi:hypothetical protein